MAYKRWTQERLAEARRILGEHDRLASACAAISASLGFNVSPQQLKDEWRKHEDASPAAWLCGGARCEPPARDPAFPGHRVPAEWPGLHVPEGPPSLYADMPGPMRGAPVAELDYEDEPDTTPRSVVVEAEGPLDPAIFYGDIHAPYHSEPALCLALEVSAAIDPAIVVVMGDAIDNACVSDHDKDPRRTRDLEDEAGVCRSVLRRILAAAPNARRRIFIEGNHEYRLMRYLRTRAPELHSIISIRRLLQLDEMGWEWVPYKSSCSVGKLHLTHECGNAGPYAHIKALAAFENNVGIGHTHRLAIHYGGSVAGETHVGAMFGWLGSFEEVDYMHRVNMRSWQHGVGIGYVEPSGTVHLQAVPFIRGRCVVNGRLLGVADA
jgi:hypothetical protein